MTFTGNSVNDTATYSCNMDFELVGSATTTCTQVDVNSAAFSPAPPVCRRKWCIYVIGVAICLVIYIINCMYVGRNIEFIF